MSPSEMQLEAHFSNFAVAGEEGNFRSSQEEYARAHCHVMPHIVAHYGVTCVASLRAREKGGA